MENFKEKGLIQMYQIRKTNGNPLNPRAKYFILRYDEFGSDIIHLKACRKALAVYAEAIKNHLPLLADDLKEELLKDRK